MVFYIANVQQFTSLVRYFKSLISEDLPSHTPSFLNNELASERFAPEPVTNPHKNKSDV